MRKSMGQLSEAGSENSAGDRGSTEIKLIQTMALLPITKSAPERGILKKQGARSSNDNLLRATTSGNHLKQSYY